MDIRRLVIGVLIEQIFFGALGIYCLFVGLGHLAM